MKKNAKRKYDVEPGAPEKTGTRRFGQILQSDTLNIVKLNLIFILTSLPVVTLPMSVYAMSSVTRAMVRTGDVVCWRDYKRAFVGSWRRALGAFFVIALPLAFAGTGAWFYLSRAGENVILYVPFLVCSTVFLVTLLASSYLYGLLDMGLPFREAVKKAVLLGVARPMRAILAALCGYGLTAAGILALPISGMYVLLIGFTLPSLLGSFYVRTVLSLLEEAPPPEADVDII